MRIKKYCLYVGIFLLQVCFAGLYFSSCNNLASSSSGEEKGELNNSLFSFNTDSLKGVAIANGSSGMEFSIRSATSAEQLLKITEDGSFEKFMNISEKADYIYMYDVSRIEKSPVEGSKELYIIFNGNGYWNGRLTEQDEIKSHKIGSLICVFEDGSYYDILYPTDVGDDAPAKSLKEIKFDGIGNMYYLVEEYNSNGSSGYVIYKFDPKQKKSTKLVPGISNTYYEEFSVSKGGDWLFTKGYRRGDPTAYFLRAIPVSNTNNPANIWYNTDTEYIGVKSWIYDEESRDVYFIADKTLYKVPYKNGTYVADSKELIFGYESGLFSIGWQNLFQNGYSKYSLRGRSEARILGDSTYKYYYFIDSKTSDINYEEIVNYTFAKLLTCLLDENAKEYYKEYDEEQGYYIQHWRYKNYRNEYEIRFDEFENIKGFEKLATETKDEYGNPLADEKLFEVIIEKDLLQLLGRALESDRYSVNVYDAYDNNFFADVLYVKGTNKKIDYSLFDWDEFGGFNSCVNLYSGNAGIPDLGFLEREFFSYFWKDEFLNTETFNVDANKILEKFAAVCGKQEIDFSLECFRDDTEYSNLYTELKNEDAIHFLSASVERMYTLCYLVMYNSDFLADTCFIPNTNKLAIETNIEWDSWEYLEDLIISNRALYGVNLRNNKIVQFTDNDGNSVNEYVDFSSVDSMKISSILIDNNKFYLKSSILDSSGMEMGTHFIICFNPETQTAEDMLYYMPNNRDYEIISYSIEGNDLYCCFSKGTDVFIGRINLSTKSYSRFATSEVELKQIVFL